MLYENKAIFICCGIGAAAYGMQQSAGEYKGAVGKFRVLGGIDVDKLACQDFTMLTGAPAVQMDLFSLQDYIDFHGCRPPDNWREITPEDIFEAFGREYPNTAFISAPCKGLSGLLPAAMAASKKYQALNNLTVRSVRLNLEAFEYDPIDIFLFENVPRIRTRGAKLLEEIRQLYKYHGYEVVHKENEIHDCGELGGLGQHRNRYLFIARHRHKVPNFVYKPPKLPLKTIGNVIGPMPLPDDPAAGPMHRMPRLQWKTWVRLALIPAGGDWRDLQNINPEGYRIDVLPRGGGSFGVQDWDNPANTVTGNARVNGSNAANISDPRIGHEPREGTYKVQDWDKSSTTIVGSGAVGKSNGATQIADPRMMLNPDSTHKTIYRVSQYDEPASTVTGAHRPNNGAIVIPDPRLQSCEGKHPGVYQVVKFDETGPCVTGTRFGSGAPAIADPRVKHEEGYFHHSYGVNRWDQTSGTVTGGHSPSSGAKTVADPRFTCKMYPDSYGIQKWDEPGVTIRGNMRVMASRATISDPRIKEQRFSNYCQLSGWDETAGTVTGRPNLHSGAQSISDPRLTKDKGFHNKYQICDWDEAGTTVTGIKDVQAGAQSIADPRLGCTARNGTMGVNDWDNPAKTVTASGDVHAGTSAVADPRIPKDTESGVYVIIAEDGTWHRPLTTLELAALQSLPITMPDGSPLVLAGKSDARWREAIGNAVPPASAKAMGNQVLIAWLTAKFEYEFVLSQQEIWVKQGGFDDVDIDSGSVPMRSLRPDTAV